LQFIESHNELASQILNIKVNEKVQVMFNVNDAIFSLKNMLPEDEWEEQEEWSRCGCCGEQNKKLKACHFCG
jgi:NADH:ubiquinone oxidoreductase subunit C